MRDFRDAKVMARALRDTLKAKGLGTTHSESLELIAIAFGYENWNILSAKVEAAEPLLTTQRPPSPSGTQNDAAPPKILYCSFCGKSQHEVQKLIAGPGVFISDECVDLCTDIVEPDDDKELFRLMKGNASMASAGLAAAARSRYRTATTACSSAPATASTTIQTVSTSSAMPRRKP